MEELNKFSNIKEVKFYSNKLVDFSDNENYKEGIMDERIEINARSFDAYYDGVNEGIEKGRDLGIYENQKDIVSNLLAKNMDDEFIMEVANLSLDEYLKIKEEIMNNK